MAQVSRSDHGISALLWLDEGGPSTQNREPTVSKGKHTAPTDRLRVVRPVATAGILGLGAVALTPTPASAAPLEDWDAVAECESGNRNIESYGPSSASGFFQIIDGTWDYYGGTEFAPRAIDATYEQQLIIAERILRGQGPGAWVNGCGDSLVGQPAAPPPPAPAPNPADSSTDPRVGADYLVQEGDTLYSLGQLFGVSWEEIAEANGITAPWTIHVNHILRIPHLTQQDIIDLTGQGTPDVAPPPPPVGDPGSGQTEVTHIVQEGEWMSTIAQDYGICTPDEDITNCWWPFWEDNRDVVGDNPDRIFPGQELVVRMQGLPPVPSPAAPAAPAPAVVPTGTTYTVQEGDTLGRLFGPGWELVAIYNHIPPPWVIYPGQVLEIGEAQIISQTQPAPAPPSSGVVRPVSGAVGDDLGAGRGHAGLDLNCETGDPVHNALGGIVANTRTFDGGSPYTGYGLVVDVIGNDGALYRYAHLSQVNVSIGQQIPAGHVLGLCGSTGQSSGSHLHFERRPNGQMYGPPDSPARWLREHGVL